MGKALRSHGLCTLLLSPLGMLALAASLTGCGNSGAGARSSGGSAGATAGGAGTSGGGASGGSATGGSAVGGTATGGTNAGGSAGSSAGGDSNGQEADACTGFARFGDLQPAPGTGGAGNFADPCITSSTCPAGVWSKVNLPGLAGHVQTVVVDPVRPSDFYLFSGTNNGPTIQVYHSTDFADTWTQVNKTAAITGNPWGASIDPNPSRDPNTVPVMWSPSGYGAVGAWKSTDGGATWVRSAGCDAAFSTFNPFGAQLTDLYHIQILPDDPPNHVLATYHYYFKNNSEGGFGETWDGGATWVVHQPPPGVGTSHYVMPISGTTWAVIAQSNNGTNGIWRTTTAGRIGGTLAKKFRDGTISTDAWKKVDTLEHAHGSHQNVILPDGKTVLATGETNGARSTDCGATWTHFTDGSWAPPHQFEGSRMTNLAVTDRYIYTNSIGSPDLARAPLANPIGAANWDIAYTTLPATMTTGAAVFSMASSYDPTNKKWIVLSGVDDGGLYKYVEP